MKLVGQGRTAEIFLLDKTRILKLFRTGISEDFVKREYEVNHVPYFNTSKEMNKIFPLLGEQTTCPD